MNKNYYDILNKTELESYFTSLASSPAYRVMQEFQRNHLEAMQKISYPMRDLVSELQKQMKLYDPPLNIFKSQVESLQLLISQHVQNLPALSSYMSSLAIQRFDYFAKIKSFSEFSIEASKIFKSLGNNPLINESLLGQITANLNNISVESDAEDVNTAINKIENAFDKKLETDKGHILSFEAKLNLFVATIFFLISMFWKSNSANIINAIESIGDHLSQKIEELKSNTHDQEIFNLYAVRCFLNVTIRPFKNAQKLDKLYPNQVVYIVRTYKKWAYIEYYDYALDTMKEGWVYKKHLNPIEHNRD